MFPWLDRSAANCVDCPEHETMFSPDPDDWFCDDDITVSCRAAGGRKIAEGSARSSSANTAQGRSGARSGICIENTGLSP